MLLGMWPDRGVMEEVGVLQQLGWALAVTLQPQEDSVKEDSQGSKDHVFL